MLIVSQQAITRSDSMRLFVALPIPAHITELLAKWMQTYKEELSFRKWTNPQDYHITLQFLGDVEREAVEALQAALRGIKAESIPLSLHGAGIFGQPKAPRVLWAAVAGQLAELTALHKAVVQATSALGFVPEERPYSPHITLARRFSGSSEMKRELLELAPLGETWEADRFVLMKTNMNHSPMYEIIDEYMLKARSK